MVSLKFLYFLVIKYFAPSIFEDVISKSPFKSAVQPNSSDASCISGSIKFLKFSLCTGFLRIISNATGLGVPLILIVLTPTALVDEVVDILNSVSPFELQI